MSLTWQAPENDPMLHPSEIFLKSPVGDSEGICPANRLHPPPPPSFRRTYIGPKNNGVFIIHEDNRTPLHLYIDACTTGVGAFLAGMASQMALPLHILDETHPISHHLEALNSVAALNPWAPNLSGKLVHLFCDNVTAVMVFQARKDRDNFLQDYAHQLWLICAKHDITLGVGHVLGEPLQSP